MCDLTGKPATGWRALGPPALAAAGIGVCCGAILWADPTKPGGLSPVCPTRALFGIDCPGCGGLRMMYSLLSGDVPAAIHYNAVALVFVVLGAWSLVAWTWGRFRGRPVVTWLGRPWTARLVTVVFVVWFVVRNLPFPPFTALFV